jgi:D-3-phosphoglycerate dehydrogenase
MALRVLVTDDTATSFEEERSVLEPAGVELLVGRCRSEADLIERGRGMAGLLVSNAMISRRVLEALPELKVIVKYGVGVDNIDLRAARELGKIVARVPDYCREEVALHALALALAGLRQTHLLGAEVASGGWNDTPAGRILYRPSEHDLGIAGLGGSGKIFARYAGPLFRSILYYDPYVPRRGRLRSYRRLSSLDELFACSAVVSIHVPLTAETRGFIGRQALERARAVILVNTSRGAVVDREALLAALEAGRLAFYGADVFWEEPPRREDPWTERFLKRKDVLITPHAAWYSPASNSEVKRRAAEEALRVLRGGKPRHPVLEPA